MKQNYHRILNIPNSPVTQTGLEILLDKKRHKKYRPYLLIDQNFKDYLNPELSNIFSLLKIFPDVLIVFGHLDDENFQMKSVVHSDIRYQNGNWVDVPFSINWEITDTVVDINWWDVAGEKKCYPPPYDSQQYLPPVESDQFITRFLGSGIHYGEWNKSYPETYDLLENCKMKRSNPLLIRTDIPHSVSYSKLKNRISISLRFPIEEIPDWKSALEVFKSFY
jgi:hypothetical protein